MTVPSRTEAASFLLSLNPPAWHLRHSRAVAEVAGWLASRIAARGRPINRGLVEAAALLHDVDKILPATDSARRLPHGEGAAAWLARHDAGELAEAIAGHPVTRLAGPDGERWLAEASIEAKVVSYADKRAAKRLGPMSARFARWAGRKPRGWSEPGGTTRARADRLEREVCALAGIEPPAGRRLREWLAPAGLGDERSFYGRLYIAAVVRCFPGKRAGGSDLRPSAAMVRECVPWLRRELELVPAPVVISVGTLALEELAPGIRLDDAVGSELRLADGRPLIPLPHPSGASPWPHLPGNADRLERALGLIAGRLGDAGNPN